MEIEEFYIKVGLRIKEIRERKKLTQEELSEKAGISLDYLGKIEVNINNIGLIALFKIVKALDVSFAEFFETIV